jgi:hypothetical protein
VNIVAERVAKGAALLDEKVPGWDQRIDLEILAMRGTCECVLGQLFEPTPEGADGYWVGLDRLAISRLGAAHAAEYGFACETSEIESYVALGAEWRRLIGARRTEVAH